MHLHFAPLEGITTCIYRNTHAALFDGCDSYWAPFIAPSNNEKISRKRVRDILPERNGDLPLRVQVLANQPESFLLFSQKLAELGYKEVNLNLGCPSATVVNKGRGAGQLRDPKALEDFLDAVFTQTALAVSLKTRIGFADSAEFELLTEIYNKYPLSLLVIHPRVRADFYQGTPDLNAFAFSYAHSKHPLCYNGDIRMQEDFLRILELFPDLEHIMIGRGAVQNPAIFRQIKGGAPLTTTELLHFSAKLTENYRIELQSDTFTLQKMKEVWLYMIQNYPQEKKVAKAIKKATRLAELQSAVTSLPELG